MNTSITSSRNRANNFRRWAVGQINEAGRRYTEGSVRTYIAHLRNFEKRLVPHALEGTRIPSDLFELSNRLELRTAVSEIRILPGFGEFIAENHGSFEAAIALYGRFLALIDR